MAGRGRVVALSGASRGPVRIWNGRKIVSGFVGIGHTRPPTYTKDRPKDCHCYTCGKDFHHLGIMSHRAAHRNRRETCKIMYSDGRVLEHRFGPSISGTGEPK